MAKKVIDQIQQHFANYKASFDLEDCDRILVVKSMQGQVESLKVISLLRDLDFHSEVLADS